MFFLLLWFYNTHRLYFIARCFYVNILVIKEKRSWFIVLEQYNDILTVDELCEALMIGKNAAYTLLASGQISVFRYNRVWKIPKQGVIDYVLTQSKLA